MLRFTEILNVLVTERGRRLGQTVELAVWHWLATTWGQWT